MLPPTLSKYIDDLMRADLLYWRDFWFGKLLLSTKIVVAGLIFEGPELVQEIVSTGRHWLYRRKFHFSLPENHAHDWVKMVAFCGWMLIVLGVAGEWITDVMVSDADANLQTFNAILLSDARRESAFASERSASAYERAAKTEQEAAQEMHVQQKLSKRLRSRVRTRKDPNSKLLMRNGQRQKPRKNLLA